MQEGAIKPTEVLRNWELPEITGCMRLRAGINNESWRVDAGTNGVYVLRLYRNAISAQRVAFEHRILQQLALAGLGFAVPEPLPTGNGSTWAAVALRDGSVQLCSLTRWIEGAHPTGTRTATLRLLGATLARLDAALANISGSDPSTFPLEVGGTLLQDDWPSESAFGDLGFAAGDVSRLSAQREAVNGVVPAFYRRLPHQLVHNDFVPSNVLVKGNRVTGVLDFEFSAVDLRVLDFAAALMDLCMGPLARADARVWSRIRAFAGAYCWQGWMDPFELHALGALMRYRQLVVLRHWFGRWQAGVSGPEHVQGKVRIELELDAWLAKHEGELLERCLQALAYEQGSSTQVRCGKEG